MPGETDQYAGPRLTPGFRRKRSWIHGWTARFHSAANDRVHGMSLHAAVEPLLGTRRRTGSLVSTALSPARIRSIQGRSSS